MEQRYETRLAEMLEDAQVPPRILEGVLTRLEAFVHPFAEALQGSAPRRHALEYLTGLISKLDHKTGEGIAYLHDQERQGIQKFIGYASWDCGPLLATLADQVGQRLGEPDAVLVFDPSGFAKKGTKSVGVARQWCGRLGKVENCQVGVFMAYVSRKEHALVNMRLYLPEEWARDKPRRFEAGVPATVKFQTRHELALEMLKECGGRLPHSWVGGDDEMGRPASFRGKLREAGERYLLAVPSNLLIRDVEVAAPEYAGRGRRRLVPFVRLERWRQTLPESVWTRIEVRDGEKGPLAIEVVKRRIQARTETGGTGPRELLLATRERELDGTYKHDYYFSNAAPETTLKELARVAKASHRVEECFERAKGEAGLADSQGRNWKAWHHHQTLALLAAWFLTEETRRGKNPDARADDSATSAVDRGADRVSPGRQSSVLSLSSRHALVATQRTGEAVRASIT